MLPSYTLAVDLLRFLDDRLKFVSYLYDSTVPPFQEIKRKIEEHEDPYDSYRHPEDEDDEPPFQEEWERADLAIDVIGMSCLGLVENALHLYLTQFVKEVGGKELLNRVCQMKQKGWFAKFRALFATDPDYDWATSGADIDLLEQINLTRNDFQHNGDPLLLLPCTYQDKKHAERFPNSAFRHSTWPPSLFRNARLVVTRDKLEASMRAVRILAEHLIKAERIVRKKHAKGREQRPLQQSRRIRTRPSGDHFTRLRRASVYTAKSLPGGATKNVSTISSAERI